MLLNRFQTGELSLTQAVRNLLDVPQIPDFEGIWEMLMAKEAAQALLKAVKFEPARKLLERTEKN